MRVAEASTPAAAPPGALRRVLDHPAARALPILLIAGLTLYVLHLLSRDVGWTALRADILAASPGKVTLALAATVVSFAAISCYDVIAVRSVAPGAVPAQVAAAAGVTGSAISNLLGFSYLTGTAVRYRIYTGFGLDLKRVAEVITTSWIGFSLGLVLMIGLLLLHPDRLVPQLPIGGTAETLIGLGVLAGFAALFVRLARGSRRLFFFGQGIDLPPARLAALLAVAGVVDLIAAAACLYVLMPDDIVPSFPSFFVVYIGAVGLGVISHAPGGLGVFEATIIAGLGGSGRSDLLAALILYRLVYTVAPFLVAITGLAVAWVVGRRTDAVHWTRIALRIARPVIPAAAAAVAALVGGILLISGSLPGNGSRLAVLGEILPLSVIEVSHLTGSVAGLLLVVVARGLYLRERRAWTVAMGLVVLGIAASLVKGLDWLEALSLLGALALLGVFRAAFYRTNDGAVIHLSADWIASLVTLLAAAVWIGLFAYGHVEYRNALWWDFALHGDAPRFLRASLALALVVMVLAANALVAPRARPGAAQPIPNIVRQLIAGSEDTEPNIALLGDKAFLISPEGNAFLAYRDTGRSLISKGDPVGNETQGRDLIWALREKADKLGRNCAFYAVTPRFLPTYLDLGLTILKIGEIARVPLRTFSLEGPDRKGLRHSVGRASRDGYDFAIVPAAEVPALLPALRAVSDAWMELKSGEEKSFAVGNFDDAYLSHFDHAVLRHRETGRIAAFANLWQGANRHELSLDLMRYDPDATRVAMDALFAQMMTWGAAQGFGWFNLGAAPFSGMANRRFATRWNRIGGMIHDHGERFYHFEGLEGFKSKFGPVWTPNYLATPGGLTSMRILYEVNGLISGGIQGLLR